MASFSRAFGAVPRQLLVQLPPCVRMAGLQFRILHAGPSSQRALSTSRCLRASAKKHVPKSNPAKAPAKPAAASHAPRRPAAAPALPPKPVYKRTDIHHEVAKTPGAKTIYESTKHRSFMFRTYALGIACFTGGAYYFQTWSLNPNPGLPAWIPYAGCAISMMWMIGGLYLITRPAGLVKSVKVVAKPVDGRKVTMLRIEGVRTSPLAHVVFEAPSATCEVNMPAGLLSRELAIVEQTLAEHRKPKATDPVVLRPFLWLGRVSSRAFQKSIMQSRKILLGEQLLALRVEGRGRWKIDAGGWFDNNGKTFDALVKAW